MNFKDKLLEQLNRGDLADNEAKVNAIIEAVGDFIPKGTYNDLSKRLKNIEQEKNDIQVKLENQSKTAEELATKKLEAIIKQAEEREKNASLRENSAEAREILINAGLSKEDLNDELLSSIVSIDRDQTMSRVNNLANLFKTQHTKVEAEVKKSYYNDNPKPPASDKNTNVVTKEQLNKMTYSEELAFANENPTLYAELTK